jgi:predicted permease
VHESERWYLNALIQDIRYALRMLWKSPGFAAIIVLTLGLGIGANAAVFSLTNAVLLRTLAVAHPRELVLFSDSTDGGATSGSQTGRWSRFSSLNFTYFGDHGTSFKELCAFQSGWVDLNIRLAGAAERRDVVRGRPVSGNFFQFLGLNAAAGRLLTPDDDRLAASPAVVLSYGYWSREFHDDFSIVGKAVEIKGVDFTVVGIAPHTFSDVKDDHPDFWLPLVFQPQLMSKPSYADDPGMHWLNIMARLKPGVTLLQAQTAVNGQLKQLLATQSRPETSQDIANSYIELASGAAGISYSRLTYAGSLRVLAGIVVIVLLIACANVANLLLSRSSVRTHEISIRLAVGASRTRLIRQLLTENMVFAALAGTLGVLAARWGAMFLASLVIGSTSVVEGPFDIGVLLFVGAVSFVAGILFGLIPALRSSRVNLGAQLKGSDGSRVRSGFANALVTFQIAACVVLLVVAGLFLRSLQNLDEQELGFDSQRVVVARIDPLRAGYSPAQTPALYQALMDRVEAIPGVVSATVLYSEPLSGNSWTSNFAIEGEAPRPAREATVHKELVGPNYFATQGIPILLGRDIGPQDGPGSPLVTVINQTMARTFFPGANPIGRRFSLGKPFNPQEAMTIVGVAADARFYSLRDPVPPMEFCAAFTVPDDNSAAAAYARALELRVNDKPRAIATAARAALAQVAPALPVTRVFVLADQVSNSLRQNRSAAELSSAFGVLALLLACVGVYGTVAYRVSRRTKEIGIRLALGSQRSDILWLIVRESLILVTGGLLIGVPLAFASTRIVASLLFEIPSTDPLALAGVALLLILLVTLAACYIPARRAMRVDPILALRYE